MASENVRNLTSLVVGPTMKIVEHEQKPPKTLRPNRDR